MLKKVLLAYIFIACCYSVIVFAVFYGAHWKFSCQNWKSRPRQYYTFHRVVHVADHILEYRGENDRLPVDLNDPKLSPLLRVAEPDSIAVDGWGRAIEYKVIDDKFTLSSLGRDGKAGGIGLDADMVAQSMDVRPKERGKISFAFPAPPTFLQYMTTRDNDEIYHSNVLMWATISFAFAFFFVFLSTMKLWMIAARRYSEMPARDVVSLPAHLQEEGEKEAEYIREQYDKLFFFKNPELTRRDKLSTFLLDGMALAFPVGLFTAFFGAAITILHSNLGH